MILALLLLLLFGAGVLFFAPRSMKLAASRTELMTGFMERDYVCCDLSAARQGERCQEVLRAVGELAAGDKRSEIARAAANSLANCPAAELMGFAGDPAVVRQPIGFLASKIQGQDLAAAQKAARLLVSDSTVARESAASIKHGVGPLCFGLGKTASARPEAGKPDCPRAPRLFDALSAIVADEKETETDRQKAAAMLADIGESGTSAVPALVRALDSRTISIRASAVAGLAAMGKAASSALPALKRRAHEEPAPGLRQDILAALGRVDTEAGCCFSLFRQPDPFCEETLTGAVHRVRQLRVLAPLAAASEDCPAALVLEIAGTPASIGHPMPQLEQALRAPEIAMRRRAAVTVALIAGTLQWQSRIDRNVVDALQGAFRSGIPELELDAAEALRQITDASPGEGSSSGPEAFLTVLEDLKSDRRAAAAWALGEVGRRAASAVPALRKALDGQDEVVADAAYAALNRIAIKSGLERLGYKRDGKYELKPEVFGALMKLAGGEPAALSR